MATFPISHDAGWPTAAHEDGGKGFHIHALGHITQQGQVYFQVTTSSNSWGLGFHSGVSALGVAGDGTVVWASPGYIGWADAKSAFWSRSTNVDTHFSDWIPADKLAQVESLEFLIGQVTIDKWSVDWQKISSGISVASKSITEIIGDVAAVMTGAAAL